MKFNLKKFTWYGFVAAMLIIIVMATIAHFNPTPSEDEGVPLPDLDNFKISELTDDQIRKIPYKSFGLMTASHTCGDDSGIGGSEYKYESVDYDHCKYSAQKKIGITTFNATRAEDTTLTLEVKTAMSGGIGKMLILRDGYIIETFDCGENKTFTYEVEGESIFYVKGLFEEAQDVKVEVTRTFDE
jgi:hypothetical protein